MAHSGINSFYSCINRWQYWFYNRHEFFSPQNQTLVFRLGYAIDSHCPDCCNYSSYKNANTVYNTIK